MLGALPATGEYMTGMIRASLTAVPTRLPVLWAKLGVFAVVGLIVSESPCSLTFGIGHGDPGAARRGLARPAGRAADGAGTGLYLMLTGLFGLAIGAVVRNTAVAISVLVGVMLVLPVLTNVLPVPGPSTSLGYLPSNAGQAILSVQPTSGLLAPWTGLALFAGYVAAVVAMRGGSAQAARRLTGADDQTRRPASLRPMTTPIPGASPPDQGALAPGRSSNRLLAARDAQRGWTRRHPRATDAMLAAVVLLVSLPPFTALSGGTWPTFALVILMVVPLVWRRRWPFAVLLFITVPAVVQLLTNRPVTDFLAFLIIFYTIAACSRPRLVLASIVLLEVGVVVGVTQIRAVGSTSRSLWTVRGPRGSGLGSGHRTARDRRAARLLRAHQPAGAGSRHRRARRSRPSGSGSSRPSSPRRPSGPGSRGKCMTSSRITSR